MSSNIHLDDLAGSRLVVGRLFLGLNVVRQVVVVPAIVCFVLFAALATAVGVAK